MSEGTVSEDRGFKELIASFARDAVEVFVPRLIAAWGPPAEVVALQQELSLPELPDGSRFCDLALRCRWPDGHAVIIVPIEHWSRAAEVDLERTLWYVMGLRMRERRQRGARWR